MSEGTRAALFEFARELNHIACSLIQEDGEHAAMFFLRMENGDVQASLFAAAQRPLGEARAREMAEAVRSSDADAVAFVSEAWSARAASVPGSGRAGDTLDAQDVLLVAAADRDGNAVALETTVSRHDDGSVELGKTEEFGEDYRVDVLNDARSVWV